jgi:hypothetical protein
MEDKFADGVASDVLKVLSRKRFFEELDDCMCPTDPVQLPSLCDGTYGISITIRARLGFDEIDTADIIEVFASKSGGCDCEILFSIAEESRLKSRYWKARTHNHSC